MNSTRIIYFLYQLLLIVASPLVAAFLLYRGIKDRRYFRHLTERLGFLPATLNPSGAQSFWIHAVSVGEVISATALIARLKAARPRSRVYLSTATLTGRAMALERLGTIADGVFFVPMDYRFAVRRVLRRLRPSAVVILETEIWPNLYREAKCAGAALLVVNGRISDKALPSYQQWSWFFKHVLAQPDRILAQSEQDRARYVMTGAPAERVMNAGNLKYDFPLPGEVAPDLHEFLEQVWPEKVWVAASTMPGAVAGDPDEDDAVIAAFSQLAQKHSRLLLILVPRKPERFYVVAEKLARAGISFVRRTALPGHVTLPGVLLVDSMGELATLFRHADVVFMGGTLASRGGHNILEPSCFGKPVVAGPHMENFAAMAQEFTEAKALIRIADASQLASQMDTLFRHKETAEAVGARAQELANSKRGVADRVTAEILDWASFAIPAPERGLLARTVLTPLSWIWLAGHRMNLGRQFAEQRKFSTKVISIGGLAMGGTGKSPLVAHLAARVAEAGGTAAILTRGYRRKSALPVVIVPKGGTASVDLTGDEAQMFVRQGHAHIGIGGDRYASGHRVEQELQPSVFLLDDGFQHARLARNHDVVLINALDPLAGGLFPLGRLREPLEGLSRATAVVITHTEPGVPTTGLEQLIHSYHPGVPIFHSRVVPEAWVDLEWGTSRLVIDASAKRVAAFCGLGSPGSFWRSLDALGLTTVYRWTFGDHHRYRTGEIERFAWQAKELGAEAIVTTEKDAMNLCAEALTLSEPLRIYWLRLRVEIENEEEFLRLLL